MKSRFLLVIAMVLVSSTFVSAVGFGYGNIDDNTVTVLTGDFTNLSQLLDTDIDGSQTNDQVLTWNATLGKWFAKTFSAAGDITSVNAIGPYILGGGTSGDVDIDFNDTLLNQTIIALAGAGGEPLWSANYTLFNDTWSSTYNATYDAYNSTGLIQNWSLVISGGTPYTAGTNLTLAGTEFSLNETGVKEWLDNIYQPLGDYFTKAEIISFAYYNASDFDINDYYLKDNPFGYYNVTTLPGGAVGNPFDQVLNTTSNVTFNNISANNITANFFIGDGSQLNTNRSTWWAGLNTYTTTQFNNIGDSLTVNVTWLNAIIDSNFGGKTTDDLTEGVTNLYDNQSWNETSALEKFALIDEPLWTSNDSTVARTGVCGVGEFVTNTTVDGVGCASPLDNSAYPFDQFLNTTSNVTHHNLSLTGDLDMINNTIANVGYIDWDLTADPVAMEGRTHWSEDSNTLEIDMTGGEVALQVGQEQLIYVRNNGGVDILNGQAVYLTGAAGNFPTIALADNTDSDKFDVLGLATENINNGNNGYVTIGGLVRDLNTSAWNEGDKLYLMTGGNYSNTHPPTATEATIVIGTVVRNHTTIGSIQVDSQSFTLGNNFNGTLRSSVINKNDGEASAVGFTAVNDLGHFTTMGLAGSNNVNFPGEVSVYYAPGYGDHWQAVDGNKDFVWFTDPTDSHDNSALNNEVMRLEADGDLIIQEGALNMTSNPIYLDGITLKPLDEKNALIDGPAYGVYMTGPSGQNLPHLIIQSGGASQASVVLRSQMIVNEIAGFHNTTNATSCIAYMDQVGELLKIDCNTTTSGADLLVGDDMQVVGDVWLKDADDEWHQTTRDFAEFDHLMEELYFGTNNLTVNATHITINNTDNQTIIVNIDGVNYEDGVTASSAISSGTNQSPNRNYFSWQESGGNIVLTNDAAEPVGTQRSEIVRIIQGDGIKYLYAPLEYHNRELLYHLYERSISDFSKYISGFSIDASPLEINFTSGQYWISMKKHDSDATSLLSDGFYTVNSSGHFIQCSDLSCLTLYNDGGSISNPSYFNVVWALIPDSPTTSKLVAIPQNTPSSAYNSIAQAEADAQNTITFLINDDEVNKHSLVLARTIVRKSNNQFQIFSSGTYFETLIGVPTAGSAAGGTNDHSLLTNLDYASSGHTGFLSDEFNNLFNFTNGPSFYNATDFLITDYFTKAEIISFSYYNATDFDINDYYLKTNPFGFYNATDFAIADLNQTDEILSVNTTANIQQLVNDTYLQVSGLNNMSGNLTFDDGGYVASNTTCIKIRGSTSLMEIC